MAEKQELEINISNDGTVTINVQGAKGTSCLGITKELEEALGVVVERDKKSSFYEEGDKTSVHIQKGEL